MWDKPITALREWLAADISGVDLVKATVLALLLIGIVVFIGKQYIGRFTNERIGPLAIRNHPARDQFYAEYMQVTRDIVPLTMDDTNADCRFVFEYFDKHRRVRKAELVRYDLKVRVRLVGFGRVRQPTSADAGTEETRAISLAASRVDYINSLAEDLLATQRAAYERAVDNFWYRHLRPLKLVKELHPPREKGRYLTFHFPWTPDYVLFRHPDREVRTTAWLTVLTTAFAIVMQLLYG